jgi:hypothetical protein
MKNFLAFFAATVVVALSLVSCQKDFDPSKGLNGTTWVASQNIQDSEEQVVYNFTLSFQESTYTISLSYTYLGKEQKEGPFDGTYKLSGNTVSLTGKNLLSKETSTITGTISGNKMTFSGVQGGFNGQDSLVFTKK